MQVLPGARVPADGGVLAGSSHVDESMLTGESLPVPKTIADTVIGGTMNLGGMLQVPCHLRVTSHHSAMPSQALRALSGHRRQTSRVHWHEC